MKNPRRSNSVSFCASFGQLMGRCLVNRISRLSRLFSVVFANTRAGSIKATTRQERNERKDVTIYDANSKLSSLCREHSFPRSSEIIATRRFPKLQTVPNESAGNRTRDNAARSRKRFNKAQETMINRREESPGSLRIIRNHP